MEIQNWGRLSCWNCSSSASSVSSSGKSSCATSKEGTDTWACALLPLESKQKADLELRKQSSNRPALPCCTTELTQLTITRIHVTILTNYTKFHRESIDYTRRSLGHSSMTQHYLSCTRLWTSLPQKKTWTGSEKCIYLHVDFHTDDSETPQSIAANMSSNNPFTSKTKYVRLEQSIEGSQFILCCGLLWYSATVLSKPMWATKEWPQRYHGKCGTLLAYNQHHIMILKGVSPLKNSYFRSSKFWFLLFTTIAESLRYAIRTKLPRFDAYFLMP